MKKTITSVVLFFTLIVFVFAQNAEDQLVRKSFDNYKASILNDKGDEAIKYVDSRTIKYYGDILELVKNADSTKVESLSILDKLMVFSVRHRTSKNDILSFDGEALLVYAIKSGMVGKNSVANNSIGEVMIDGNFAKGRFIAKGQQTPFYFHFYKEQETWRVDLTSIFSISTISIQKMADDSGKNVDDFLFSLLEMVTGRKPGKEIWQPVK